MAKQATSPNPAAVELWRRLIFPMPKGEKAVPSALSSLIFCCGFSWTGSWEIMLFNIMKETHKFKSCVGRTEG
ncbi:hypothetical protein ASB62_09855 [Chlorobium limicola]|uniref:Uncharacterized protein n=1 Tax=Chlorobium limicola TaxID=1092 RepID=A0A101J4Y8_CHLLI|nr:hypothetical protein ASB62_09855 [Chlorobium limicola]